MNQLVLGLFLIAIAAVMGFYGTQLARDGWIKISSKTEVKSTEQLKPLHLNSYWENDFSNTLRSTKEFAYNLDGDIKQKKFTIQLKIFRDFSSNTKFIGFYIPSFKDTFEICELIAKNHKNMMDDAEKEITIKAKDPADKSSINSHGFSFSNLIYIYHESDLSLEQLGILTTLYRNKNLSVQFRGNDYATTRWLQGKAK